MNAEQTLQLARRFIELSPEKRRLFLNGMQAEGIDFSLLPIPAGVTRDERDGLSYAQQRMWFLWQLDPQGAAYNLPMAVRLNGELNDAALQAAFDGLVARHETLRSLFGEQDGQVRQRILEPFAVAIARHDLSAVPAAAQEQQVRQRADAEALAPFDLAQGPLLRVQLLKLAEQEHVLLLTLHHIVADGWSYNVLIDEFIRLYDAACSGVEADLQALPIQYRDYALWQRSWLEAGEQERQLDYWRGKLGGDHAPLELPIDHPRPLSPSYRGARHQFQVAPALAERLRGLAREQGVTLFMVLLAAFKVLLHRYSGQQAIRVGVPVANRNRTEVEGLIGCFINTQVLHTEVDPLIDVRQLLQRVKDAALGAQAHQELPFERLVEALGLERSLSVSPLFQVLYNHQSQVADAAAIKGRSGLSLAALERETRIAQFDLTLDTIEQGGKLFAAFGYATDLLDRSTVERMGVHYSRLLEALVDASSGRVGELAMLDDAQRQQILHDWNATQTDYPLERCVHQLIEAQVERSPQGPALVFGGQSLSYAELNARVNRLAHRLIALGVQPDALVGIAVERSIEMVVGLLAILKAGGAYVPLDPDYPAERLAYMLEDSGVKLLLSQSHLDLPLAEGVQRIDLDRLDGGLESQAEHNPEVALGGENLAYVIYTSGSTGKPKGAGNRHSALTNRLCWMQQAYGLDASDTVLQKTPFSFDVSVWEFFWPLMTGARLVVAAPGDHRDPAKLVEVINREGVTTLHFVPSMLQAFLQDDKVSSCSSLKRIVCSGEALPVDAQQNVFARLPQANLYNLYGPTEAAIDVTHWRCLEEGRDAVPIGRPIANLACHVLDADLQPVPVGVLGELYLAGAGLARGYHQRPALTAERFFASPFGDGARLYRTGDLARYRGDGVIEYAGRIDHQVKLRGLRIELGEIEARLLEHQWVREAAVLAVEGKSLVGYLVLAEHPSDWRDALATHLARHVPEYMVPTQWVDLAQMPLSPNGKLDRKALPAPDGVLQADYAAPQGELETRIAAIWQDILGSERIGRHDNFFELGGDSIVSIQVVSRARQAGIQFTPKDLFQHQTVRSLATVAEVGATTLPIDQGPVTGDVALTPVQRWFFELPMTGRHHWNQSLLLEARQPIEPEFLEQALRAVVSHHDALRLCFVCEAGQWRQWYADADDHHDLLWQGEDGEVFYDEVQRSLDLASGPLLRAALLHRPGGGQRLLLAVHHLVVDGVSWRILLEDLQAAYQRLAAGHAPALPAKTSSYQAWAARLQGHGQAQQQALADWLSRLDGPVQELPQDDPQGGLLNAQGAALETRLDAGLTERLLKHAPAAYRTQVNDLLLTALARVLCRWSGGESVWVQMEGHGREDLFEDIDLTRTVGWFTSLYPVKLTPAAQLPDSLKAIKEQLRSVPDKGLGYGLLRYLGDDASRQALAELPQPRVTFNYLGQFDGQFDTGTLFVPAGKGAGQTQAADAPLANWLSVEGQVYGGELSLRWGYSSAMYRQETIQRLADELVDELRAVIEHCSNARSVAVTPSDFPLATLTQAQLDAFPLPARNIDDIYPLSPMQQGMLFHSLYEQAAGDYVNQLRVDVQGLDVERFRAAWEATAAAHDILRSAFVWQELESPVQVVHQQVQVPFALHDWRGQPSQAQALAALGEAERSQGFDLSQAPLLRLVLVRTDAQIHHLIYTHHHILMDGWSNAQLLGEVLQRYAGQTPQAPVGRYRDYIAWLQGQDKAASEAFWREQLAELQEPTVLAQAAAGSGEVRVESGHVLKHCSLDAVRTARLNAFAREQKVTVNTLVQAAWLLLLQRYTGNACVAFGTTVAGRPAELVGIEQQVGLFINTLPVIAGSRPDQSVAAWLAAVQAQNLSLRELEHTPLANIQRWAGQGGESLFDTLLVFENFPISEALQHGTAQGVVFGEVANQDQTHYPLTLGVTLGDTLALHMSFDQMHFSVATVERLSVQLLHLLEQFAVSAERRLGEIALATAEEHARQQAQNHPQPYPLDLLVHQRYARLAVQQPDRTAVIFDGKHYSYGELDARANRLAHALVARGVRAEVRVGVAMPRSEGLIVALLAVLKAGGAYVPLDTSYPRERLAYLMRDSGLALLLTDSRVSAQLPIDDVLSVLELDRLDLNGHSVQALEVALEPDNLAYVIYTSGSTGNPKGVSVTHGPLAMHCQAIGERYEMRDSDCELHFMSFAFDGAHERWLTSLTHGGSLLIRDDSLWTPEQTYDAMLEHGVTVAAFPPVYLQQLAEHAERVGNPPAVRIYCFGGDAVPNASFERVKRALNPAYIINGYGPTETVVTPLIWKAGREVPCGAAYAPIGSRIGDRSAYVLDADLNLLPQGMAGELYLGGSGVARGYLNRPAMTAERFVADPFSATGGVLYRTGDLVRQRADGSFDYLERIDNQVKIRGFRIELGEVEASLQALEGVREAVVVAQEGEAGSGKRLVGYVVASDDAAGFFEGLREQLKASLPAHMVPAHLMRLERLPLTPNGKLDRKNLPRPDLNQLQQPYVAPQNELQRQLARIWEEVLKLEQVGLNDNFFELGGDSIISIQVVSRARQLGVRLTPKDLFQHQTIQALASVARQGEATLAIDQGPVRGESPLLPVQRMFFDNNIPQRHHWNQSVMLKPTRPLQPEALERALQHLVEHHDGLRLTFRETEVGWTARYQEPQAQGEALLQQARVADAQALHELGNAVQRSLSLQQGPLLRALLATLDDGSQRLLLVIHHLVVDGVSWRILFEDLQLAYRRIEGRQTVALPAKTSSTKDWAEQLQAHARSTAMQAELGYWLAQLQGASVSLPCDHPQGALTHRNAVAVRRRLDAGLTRRLLQEAPAAYRTQVNDLLLTALTRTIARWTGEAKVLVQLEGHGREDLFDAIDLTRTVGWFTSVFPARLSAEGDLGASLKGIKEQLRAIPNKGIGFGVLAHLGEPRARVALGQLPVPRLTFNYLGQFDGSFDEADTALFAPTAESGGEEVDLEGPLGNQLALDSQVFGGELDLSWTFSSALFEVATIERLADNYQNELRALIEHCCSAANQGVTPSDFPLARLTQSQLDRLPIAPALIEDVYPLSPMQAGMLFHSLLEREAGHYINQMRVAVEGLDVERFKRSWQAAVDRHEVLRASFVEAGGQPIQVIRRQMQMPFVELDWSTRCDLEQSLDAWAEEDRGKGFDLHGDPLLRVAVIRTGSDRHQLIYTHHHILLDGWSSARLLGEVLQGYSGSPIEQGGSSRYRDYIDWLQRQDALASENFWKHQLSSLDAPTRLSQAIRHIDQLACSGYGDYRQTLDREQTRALDEFARNQRVTLNTLIQAAWSLLLQRYTGQQSVAFGTTVAGRPADLPGVEEQLGLFINTLPVVVAAQPEQQVGVWLQALQALNLRLREHEHSPLYEIQHWAGWGGEALFDSILVFENYPVSQALQQGAQDGLVFQDVRNHEQTNYPLTLLIEQGQTLTIHYGYNREHFSDDGIQQIARHVGNLLGALVRDDQVCLGELMLLQTGEQQRLVQQPNRAAVSYPNDQSIHRLIEIQAQQRPEAIALMFGEQALSYRELDQRANRLAHRLRALGVGPEELVGIAVERSPEMVVGLLGILKAGGAYLPLDPHYPRERLAYMLHDSGIRLLLTQAHLLPTLAIPENVACLDLVWRDDWLAGYPETSPDNLVQPQSLAYVIYTSGSTGQPKGVCVAHRALAMHCQAAADIYGVSMDDCLLQTASISFDAAAEQIFMPLIQGARIVLVDIANWEPERLVDEVQSRQVSVLDLPPGYVQQLGDLGSNPLKVRSCILGGEAWDLRLIESNPGLQAQQWFNAYGPTEAVVSPLIWPVDRTRVFAGGYAPIGHPVGARRVYLLNQWLEVSPRHVAAELYIGGAGLARSYYDRPALTAERFIPDPFDQQGGGRLYRSGDLARYRDDSVIEYLGRIDQQVKVRGFRIELGEIEAQLLAHPLIREAAVVAQEGPLGSQLVAYLVPHEALEVAQLRSQLKATLASVLPGYMIPAHWLVLDRLPLTPNGKLDRKVLPAVDASQMQAAYVAPQSELEQQVAAIWQKVLTVERIGLNDHFFELGGHSLLAVNVVSRIALELGLTLTPQLLFQHPVLSDFVARLHTGGGVANEQKLHKLEALLDDMEAF
ncbi:non-ribosomal peptide synthetase [Pseudomonas sp. PA15(2017)]|uniref:non-ribosomal peptide synthetase n=1 Tax=Pseudomonas sp. PA15(2017) TaxID=1932111 RepID=UPI000962CD9D|nr:non-ribosomal peptide synthetase [Pseudomonas sp. PA15(2017)]OLU26324.1 non-ribosomal peptide synthetase [Pseudomonas sp. PA15(2017)]